MRSQDEVSTTIIGGAPHDRNPPIVGSIDVSLGGPDTRTHVDVDLTIGSLPLCWLITDTPSESEEPTTLLPDLPNLDLTIRIGMMSDFML
jgi:hypothetical protein